MLVLLAFDLDVDEIARAKPFNRLDKFVSIAKARRIADGV
jgi:hypothetical protein